MALRFLADHCISNLTVQTLQEVNHVVVRLRDVLPVESSDAVVIAKAQEIDAILLSSIGCPFSRAIGDVAFCGRNFWVMGRGIFSRPVNGFCAVARLLLSVSIIRP